MNIISAASHHKHSLSSEISTLLIFQITNKASIVSVFTTTAIIREPPQPSHRRYASLFSEIGNIHHRFGPDIDCSHQKIIIFLATLTGWSTDNKADIPKLFMIMFRIFFQVFCVIDDAIKQIKHALIHIIWMGIDLTARIRMSLPCRKSDLRSQFNAIFSY